MSFGTNLAPNLLGDKRDAKVLIEIQFASSPPCKTDLKYIDMPLKQ